MDEIGITCSSAGPSVLHEDEESMNKRKIELDVSLSQRSDIEKSEPTPGCVPEQCDDILNRQLEDILLENLTSIFQEAIKKIVDCGYSEAVARRAISRHGLFKKGEDLVSNVVNDTVAVLQKGMDVDSKSCVDRYSDFVFENLQQLAEFTLLEMVNVLKELKPSLTTAESMWGLLLCDLNISQACEIEERVIIDGCLSSIHQKYSSLPLSSSFFGDQRFKSQYFNPSVPGDSASSTRVPRNCPPEALEFGSLPKYPGTGNTPSSELRASEKKIPVSVPENSKRILSDAASRTSFTEEKIIISRKGLNKKEYASHQKAIIEKFTRFASDSGKSAGTFGFLMEKKLKSQSEGADTSSSASQSKAKAETLSADKIHQVSTNISSAAFDPPMRKARIKITTEAMRDEAYAAARRARIKIATSKPGANSLALADSSAAYGSTKARVSVTTSKPEANPPTSPDVSAVYESTKARVKVNTSGHGSNSSAFADISLACESSKARVKVTTSKPQANSPALPDKSSAGESQKGRAKVTTSNPEANFPAPPHISAAHESQKARTKITTSIPEATSSALPDITTVSSTPTFPDIYNYFTQIVSQGIYVPLDEKDKIIVELVPRVQRLQNEVHCWTEWANQKVMQAAHKLMKEKPELNALRLEKEEVERLKREKKMLDENTMKRLSEMEAAVQNATCQVDKNSRTVEKLGVENALLKKELINSKLFAAQSEGKYREALDREKTALKNAQSREQQKNVLHEDLAMHKTTVVELRKKVEKMKDLQNQIEVRLKQEMVEKETWNAQAASLKAEREQLEAAAKEEEAMIIQVAETELKRHEEDMIKVKNEISAEKLKFDVLRIAALRKSIDEVYGTNDSNVDSFENEELRRERECVMCLSNELSVVFLPCAHMVLCRECNEVHEKEGMKNCPCCRTVIKRRIPVRNSRQ